MRKSVLFMVCLAMIPLWGQERGTTPETATRMICPVDQTEYPAGAMFCPLDGAQLVPAPRPEDATQQILALSEAELRQMIRDELGKTLAPFPTRTEVARLIRQEIQRQAAQQKKDARAGWSLGTMSYILTGCAAYLLFLMLFG